MDRLSAPHGGRPWKSVQSAMVKESSKGVQTMSSNAQLAGGRGFVPEDKANEEVIRTQGLKA